MQATDSQAPFLLVVADKTLPGDVILSLGDEKFSARIASLTRSSYSHAVLVASRRQWFEADDEGVGYSDTWPIGGWHQTDGVDERVLGITNSLAAKVFRHPALIGKRPEAIESAIATIVRPWEGEDYSDFRRLVGPLEVSGRPKWWVRAGLQYYQWRYRHRASGLFCSEVIARTFQKLASVPGFEDASLFSAPRPAEWVAPGHLEKSKLQEVEGAVLDARHLATGSRLKMDGTDWDRRFRTRHARWMRHVKESVAELLTRVEEKKAAALEAQQRLGARLELQLRESIKTAEGLQLPRAKARFAELLGEFESLGASQTDSRVEVFFTLREARVDAEEETQALHCISIDAAQIAAERVKIKADCERARQELRA